MQKQFALKVGQVEYDAVDVNVTGSGVYVNHKGLNAGAHNSYHASGQEHIKTGRG